MEYAENGQILIWDEKKFNFKINYEFFDSSILFFEENYIRLLMRDCVKGLYYRNIIISFIHKLINFIKVHKSKVIHRDIKP